jgi:hypothetical protein
MTGEGLSPRDILVWARHVRKNYPHGVPLRLFSGAPASESADVPQIASTVLPAREVSKVKVAFFLPKATTNAADRDLLRAAVEKGLRLAWDAVEVYEIDSAECVWSSIPGLAGTGAKVFLACGVPFPAEPPVNLAAGACIATLSLESVRQDPACKRTFWEDLKRAGAGLQ